jgi:hypothetical protein
MALEVGMGTAGSFNGMHCELVDTRAGKPDAVVWATTTESLSIQTANASMMKVNATF